MSEFWYNIVPLAVVGCIVFFMFGMGQLMSNQMEKDKVRFEQCLAADMQWVEGSCVK
jgi:Na+/H+ antiporter NhaC